MRQFSFCVFFSQGSRHDCMSPRLGTCNTSFAYSPSLVAPFHDSSHCKTEGACSVGKKRKIRCSDSSVGSCTSPAPRQAGASGGDFCIRPCERWHSRTPLRSCCGMRVCFADIFNCAFLQSAGGFISVRDCTLTETNLFYSPLAEVGVLSD